MISTRLQTWFGTFAAAIAKKAGSPAVFSLALLSILVWAACGPYFDYSEAWQMVVNTGTTICTFLMVFVIQNSQNREGLAVQIKLDEIIRAVGAARNDMIDLEDLPEDELEKLRIKFADMAAKARGKRSKRREAAASPRESA